MIIKPLHVATVGKHQLRFFRTPNDDNRPDFPWHAIDDLQRCIGLGDNARDTLQTICWRDAEFRKVYRTIATDGHLISIAPHYLALGMIDAAIGRGWAPSSIRVEYQMAGIEAVNKLTLDLPFPSEAYFAWLAGAMMRHEKADTVDQ
jgi:hypothetical protein